VTQTPGLTKEDLYGSEITVFLIAEFPTDPAQQVSGSRYILDYLIFRESVALKKERKQITKFLLDPSNYAYARKKSCPFMGLYALRARNQRSLMEIVVGNKYCPKIMFASGGKNASNYVDLTEQNTIYPALEQLLK
jgi:hypothetical protein